VHHIIARVLGLADSAEEREERALRPRVQEQAVYGVGRGGGVGVTHGGPRAREPGLLRPNP
jgi:hypothetical protein